MTKLYLRTYFLFVDIVEVRYDEIWGKQCDISTENVNVSLVSAIWPSSVNDKLEMG